MIITEFTPKCGKQEAVVVGDSNYLLAIACTHQNDTTTARECKFHATHGEEFCPHFEEVIK